MLFGETVDFIDIFYLCLGIIYVQYSLPLLNSSLHSTPMV